jgi:hypothetical protein
MVFGGVAQVGVRAGRKEYEPAEPPSLPNPPAMLRGSGDVNATPTKFSVTPTAPTPKSVKQAAALLSRQLADTFSQLTSQPGRALTAPPLRNQLPACLARRRIGHAQKFNERTV